MTPRAGAVAEGLMTGVVYLLLRPTTPGEVHKWGLEEEPCWLCLTLASGRGSDNCEGETPLIRERWLLEDARGLE